MLIEGVLNEVVFEFTNPIVLLESLKNTNLSHDWYKLTYLPQLYYWVLYNVDNLLYSFVIYTIYYQVLVVANNRNLCKCYSVIDLPTAANDD